MTTDVWNLLGKVMDPEIPVVSVVDLGIVRDVAVDPAGVSVQVDITPTYSGCPAMAFIEQEIARVLRERFERVVVHTVLEPAWTTDWITDDGRRRLRESGIAPPPPVAGAAGRIGTALPVIDTTTPTTPRCPRCDASDVERIAEFGSTACKSLWRCRSCREPFDHFKAL